LLSTQAWSLCIVYSNMLDWCYNCEPYCLQPFLLGMWNLVWRQIITMSANSVWNIFYKLTVISMGMMQNIGVMSDIFNTCRICAEVTASSKRNFDLTRIWSYDPLLMSSSTLAHELKVRR
jgi:hypothetical protein